MTIGKNLRFPFIVFFALMLTAAAFGQVKFTTVLSSQEVGRDEYVQIEFVVENAKQIDQLIPPGFEGFRVVQGPVQSSGMSIVNGNMSQYKAISFVLQPIKTGKYTIPGAHATIDGKSLKSNDVTVTVTNSASGNNGNGSGGINPVPRPMWPTEPEETDREYVIKPGENIANKIKKNLFLKVQVDKTDCYIGEPIVATYKLYSRLQSESRVTKRPSLNGFSVYDMVDPSSDASSVEKVNGVPFNVHIIRKTQLIPLQAGTIELDPVEVENTIHFLKSTATAKRKNNSVHDLFDQIWGDEQEGTPYEQNITLDTKPVAISVKDLPDENKPAGFTGAVGHFDIQASLPSKNIVAQDAATLRLTVKGSGNLPMVNAPIVNWPTGVDPYDANAKEDVDKTKAPMSGSKTFEYSFIPRKNGDYLIPAIEFSYFDPVNRIYKTIYSDSFAFKAAAPSKKKVQKSPPDTPVATEDESAPSISVSEFIYDHLEWVFAILILSAVAVYLWTQNKRLRKQEEIRKAFEQKRQAAQVIQQIPLKLDPLEPAKRLADNDDHFAFYSEINRVLWHQLAEKLNLPASQLNKSTITNRLKAVGWQDDSIILLISVLDECERNLYMLNTDDRNMHNLLQKADNIVNMLDQVSG